MSYRKFEQNDIFTNRIKTHPRTYFLVNNNTTYYNNDIVPIRSGEETILHTPQGHLNLYEMNVNRTEGAGNEGLIYPFITKQGSLESFKTVSTESFQGFSYGDEIEGEYPASSTIAMDYYNSSERPRVHALRNTLNYYKSLSQSYSSENFDTEDVRLISIPSIFYGSSIKKGSVKLNFYKDGALVATIEDSARNGELIQTLPADANEGKVAGVVLYNEGFVLLTGDWDLSAHTEDYNSIGASTEPKWKLWGFSPEPDNPANEVPAPISPSSWDIDFLGTNYIPTMTMFAHAKQGEFNNSVNPTFIDYEDRKDDSDLLPLRRTRYTEDQELHISNVVKSEHSNATGTFEKTTYISKIAIYDKDKNLIGIAKLATPVKKTESRQYTFKMKLDF